MQNKEGMKRPKPVAARRRRFEWEGYIWEVKGWTGVVPKNCSVFFAKPIKPIGRKKK